MEWCNRFVSFGLGYVALRILGCGGGVRSVPGIVDSVVGRRPNTGARLGCLFNQNSHAIRRACQFFCVWGLEVGGDSVGVGGGELGEGLFPVGGGVSLDEAGVSCSFVGGFAGVCEALGGSFVFDVADGEPQEFDGGFFAGEMPAVLGDFA